MATLRITFELGREYHVYNRGVEKRNIFLDDEDYQRFTDSMLYFNTKKAVEMYDLGDLGGPPTPELVKIHAHTLMTNHFHMDIETLCENGVSLYMNKLLCGYTKYFNWKYKRVGSLFQGRYKVKSIENDFHYHYLKPYIHLNPLDYKFPQWREGGVNDVRSALAYLNQYQWSDYKDHKSLAYDRLLISIIQGGPRRSP